MQRLARLTLIFAILFAVFIVSPAFLSKQFALYPLMKNGDVFDLLTPLVLIPIYWLLFQISRDSKPSQNETIVFLIAGSDVETLTRFYDEVLSHYLWHVGLVGLSALLIYRQWKNPFVNERSGLGFAIAAGIIHGFNYFIAVVEAATAPLGVPFALLVVIFALVWGRGKLRQQPILAFFFVTYLVATLLFLGWGLYWGGLPEFSKVGIID
jgi:hypothetical protein